MAESSESHACERSGSLRRRFRQTSAGRIQASFRFNNITEELQVVILRVADLPADVAEFSTFIRTHISSEAPKTGKRKTKLCKPATEPIWNELLSPPYKLSYTALQDSELKVELAVKDAAGSATIVAQLAIQLFDVQSLDGQPQWYEFKPRLFSTVTNDVDEFHDKVLPLVTFLNEHHAKPENKTLDSPLCVAKSKTWKEVAPQLLEATSSVELTESVWELFSSECNHLSILAVLRDPFLSLLRAAQQHPCGAELVSVDAKKIFANIEELYAISALFTKKLEDILTRPLEGLSTFLHEVIEAFINTQESLMRPELEYRLNYKQAKSLVKETIEDNLYFKTFIEWCQEDERCSRFELHDLLYQPLQRLTRYPLLLKGILKNTTQELDHILLESCIRDLELAIAQQNAVVQEHDSTDRLIALESRLVWPPMIESHAKSYIPDNCREILTKQPAMALRNNQKRKHIHEGVLGFVNRSGKVQEQVVAVLLSDYLILARRQKRQSWVAGLSSRNLRADTDILQVMDQPIPTVELMLIDIPEEGGNQPKHSFTIIHTSPLGNVINFFTLKAETQFEKAEWLRVISACTAPTDEMTWLPTNSLTSPAASMNGSTADIPISVETETWDDASVADSSRAPRAFFRFDSPDRTHQRVSRTNSRGSRSDGQACNTPNSDAEDKFRPRGHRISENDLHLVRSPPPVLKPLEDGSNPAENTNQSLEFGKSTSLPRQLSSFDNLQAQAVAQRLSMRRSSSLNNASRPARPTFASAGIARSPSALAAAMKNRNVAKRLVNERGIRSSTIDMLGNTTNGALAPPKLSSSTISADSGLLLEQSVLNTIPDVSGRNSVENVETPASTEQISDVINPANGDEVATTVPRLVRRSATVPEGLQVHAMSPPSQPQSVSPLAVSQASQPQQSLGPDSSDLAVLHESPPRRNAVTSTIV